MQKEVQHRRLPVVQEYDPADLKIEPFEIDATYLRLFQESELGQIKCALTRLSTSKIQGGHFERSGNKTVHHTQLNQAGVEHVKNLIKQGHLPRIDVYWSPLAPSKSKYVCPDDQNILQAYIELNIGLVPVKILGPNNRPLPEAAIWVQRIGSAVKFDRAVGREIKAVRMLNGKELDSCEESLKGLMEVCKNARAYIKSFHMDGGDQHYHQMLHAVLVRHEKLLDSIVELFRLKRVEQAAALTRVAYEAFLNFYIDWLSPTFFGPRLQLFSAARGLSGKQRDKAYAVLGGLEALFETTAHKGRISPLGEGFHNQIYPSLSFVAHQHYSNIETLGREFSELPEFDMTPLQRQLCLWLDAITVALVLKVQNEVGQPNDQQAPPFNGGT